LGHVHGRVTLGGKPLAHAGIAFQPKTNGRESFGTTNANGEYELTYLGQVKGAGLGENSVRITKEPTTQRPRRFPPSTTRRQPFVSMSKRATRKRISTWIN
jgi:hypothetical protein